MDKENERREREKFAIDVQVVSVRTYTQYSGP